MGDNIIIPIEMCQWAISNKKTAQVSIYIALKMYSSGKSRIDKEVFASLKKALEYKSDRAITNNLKSLIEWNWVTKNPKSGYYFIKGFEHVQNIMGFERRTGARIEQTDLPYFKIFCFCAIIENLLKARRRELSIERKSRRSKTAHPVAYLPISTRILSKILEISVSQVHCYKRDSRKQGYLKIRKNYWETGISVENIQLAKRHYKNFRIKNGMIDVRQSDLLSTRVRIATRRNREKYRTSI